VHVFPSHRRHQEIVRERHADLLRQARREQLASILGNERERSPIVRVGRLMAGGLLAPLRRREAHARRPASRAASLS
jgi:hypothetical protein